MRGAVFALLICLVGPVAAAGAVHVVDVRGRSVRLEAPARRVVSLTPHITELLFVLGAQEVIIATVEHSDWPAEAREIPRIGDAFRVDRERLLLLNPELVVAWDSGTAVELVEWLETRGMPVYVTDALKLADIPRSLRDLGALTGHEETAEKAATQFETGMAELAETHADVSPLRVFYQIAPRPLYTVGGTHIISEVLALCGGQNVFSELEELASTVSVEAVIQTDPEVILAGTWPQAASPLARWNAFPMLTAVRNGAMFTVSADLLHRSTPRMLEAVTSVCEFLETVRRERAK
ncbi:MAG: cobalamin-binding protein [Gammaproteobacteria bacterium]|nr:MAG: cobalamin-binding protein [Gammaproteobacteria bacterium]